MKDEVIEVLGVQYGLLEGFAQNIVKRTKVKRGAPPVKGKPEAVHIQPAKFDPRRAIKIAPLLERTMPFAAKELQVTRYGLQANPLDGLRPGEGMTFPLVPANTCACLI